MDSQQEAGPPEFNERPTTTTRPGLPPGVLRYLVVLAMAAVLIAVTLAPGAIDAVVAVIVLMVAGFLGIPLYDRASERFRAQRREDDGT